MRIVWHAPCNAPTGYALQTMLFAPRIAALGHDVVISQMHVKPEAPALPVDGVKVIGPDPGAPEFALPRPGRLREAFGGPGPDLVIVLKDAWVLNPADYEPWNTAVYAVIDCEPMGWPDQEFFRASGARPLVVSHWAASVVRDAGFDPVYVPSGIEVAEWSPHPHGRRAAKEELGLDPDLFTVGMIAHNVGSPSRKGFFEGFSAFARFRVKHPSSVLLCHAAPSHPEGQDLHALVHELGLDGKVLFPATAADHGMLLGWYRSLDAAMFPSYGEGFCLPLVESLACGVPVIATHCSALPEKVPHGVGWLVDGQEWWNPHHRSRWVIPSIWGLHSALEKAYAARDRSPTGCVVTAAAWDADMIATAYWKPALDLLGRSSHG